IRAITPPRRPTAWAPWYAAAAALVLAAGLGAGWARERQVRLAERERSLGTLQDLAERVRHRSALIDSARDSLLAAVTAPDVRMARLAVPGAPAAARLIWSPRQGLVLLTAAAMPRPHPGRTYQLWGIPRGGHPQSLGTFAPEADGHVQAVLRVPPEAEMRVAAVTEEPDGGSAQPTGQPLMTGEIGGV
ncbi:MAG TPA: anti-sigma factor, partial [Gemmatirosa sp.]